MKMLSSTFLTRKFSLHTLGILICSVFLLHFFTISALATASNESEPDMDLYSNARKWEEKQGAQYMKDGLQGFSKKLDKALKKDVQLHKFFEEGYCDGCESVVSPDFDTALEEYLSGVPPLTKNTAYDYASIISPHLDKSKKNLNTNDIRALNTLVNIMVDSITAQTKEQMIAFRDISTMGQYYDGNTENSPYDLMADIKRLDSKFFNETPDFGPYTNTNSSDISGLISGKSSPTGIWGGTGNIAGEISAALGITSSGREKTVAAGGCENGSCKKNTSDDVSISFPTNSSLSPLPHTGPSTFQSIYESGNDWITKYGANRNNACKIAPTWFFLQGLFDSNVSLANLFSMGVYPVQEVPDLIKGFMNRKTRTPESENQQARDALTGSFKKRGMNLERPTDILVAGMQRDVNTMARGNSDKNLPLSATNDAVERGQAEYQKYLLSLGAGLDSTSVNEQDVESSQHLNVAFEEISGRSRSGNDFSKTLDTAFNYLLSKGECQPS